MDYSLRVFETRIGDRVVCELMGLEGATGTRVFPIEAAAALAAMINGMPFAPAFFKPNENGKIEVWTDNEVTVLSPSSAFFYGKETLVYNLASLKWLKFTPMHPYRIMIAGTLRRSNGPHTITADLPTGAVAEFGVTVNLKSIIPARVETCYIGRDGHLLDVIDAGEVFARDLDVAS